MSGLAWMDHAACKEVDDDLFHPIGDTGPCEQQITQAKAVCRRCPVTAQCLAYGGTYPGIYGGLTDRERRNLARQQRRRHAEQVA
jgi:WhiB family redox-sensing transcriptional regulator